MQSTLKQLEYIYWILELENVSKAAKKCFVSQPAMTQVLTDFERGNKIELFQRKGHKMTITQQGKDLQKAIKNLLDSAKVFESKLEEISQKNSGKVKVGIPPIILSVYFYDLLSHFAKEYPAIELDILEMGANELKNKLIMGDIHLALLIEPFNSENCIKYPLIESHFSVVFNNKNPLAQNKTITLEEIKEENLLILNEEFQLHFVIKNSFLEKNILPNIVFKTKQPDLLINMVIHNEKSITILPSPILSLYDLGHVKFMPIQLQTNWKINLVQRKDMNPSLSNNQFINFVKNWFQEKNL